MTFYELTERYPDERSAVQYFDERRWPDGRTCVQCKSPDTYDSKTKGSKHPIYKCRACGRRFTTTSGTIMQGTHLPLRLWLFAFHLIASSKKGISTRQVARMMGVTVKTAWHLTHRIRATMKGGEDEQKFGGIVESDETYVGGKRKNHGRGYRGNKAAVQTIIRRGTRTTRRDHNDADDHSEARTIVLSPDGNVDGRSVSAKLRKHTDPENTVLMTDESPIYGEVGKSFDEHHTVNHKRKEYVRQESDGHLAHTNTAEGFFGNLKRQINGTHHSVSKKHLARVTTEHDFKYNNRHLSDSEIAEQAIGNIEGRRLTLYKTASGTGESLYDVKQGEKPKTKTARGSSQHKRTGKKAAVPSGTDDAHE